MKPKQVKIPADKCSALGPYFLLSAVLLDYVSLIFIQQCIVLASVQVLDPSIFLSTAGTDRNHFSKVQSKAKAPLESSQTTTVPEAKRYSSLWHSLLAQKVYAFRKARYALSDSQGAFS